MKTIKIELTKLDKILITISIFLYVIGFFINGWGLLFNLILMFFILTLIKKSYDNSKLVTSYLIFLMIFIILNILIKIGFLLNLHQNYSLKKDFVITNTQEITYPSNSNQPYSIMPTLTDIKDPNKDDIMAQYLTKEQISTDLDKNLLLGNYVSIPNTNLQIKIPKTYVLQERNKESNNVVDHVLFYGKETKLSSTDPIIQILPNFFIGTVITTLTPKQWLSKNISYQGEKWNENMKTGKQININGFDMFSVGVACCGGYEQLYIYPYKLLNGQDALIIFGSYDVYADSDYGTENWIKGVDSDRNIILDKVVSTLQKK